MLKASFVSTLLAHSVASQANDLLRFYNLAVKNDATIRAASDARDAAVEARPQALAKLLPQIDGSYQQTYNDSDLTVSYPDPLTGQQIPFNGKNRGTDKNLSVRLTQPLFDLAGYYRLKQASDQAALAHMTFKISEQTLILSVAESYFSVLGSSGSLRSAKAERDALQRQLELANQNLDVGISSLTDVQEVQARYDLSVAQELDAEQSFSAAMVALEEITREPLTSVDDRTVRVVPLTSKTETRPLATLPEDFALPVPQPANAESWVANGRIGNLDILSARLGYGAAAEQVKSALSRHLPTLAANVAYNDSRTAAGALPTTSTGPAVGLQVTLPIFSGGAIQSTVREATALREQRLAEFDGVDRKVERNIRTAYQAVVLGAARVSALKQAVLSSRTALTAVETGLEIGTRTAVDRLNAQQQRYSAERNFEQARYDYLMATLRLKALAGQLAVADLQALDALLVP